MKAIESFPHLPEPDYDAIDAKDSEKVIEILSPFVKDKEYFIEIHLTTADALRKQINSHDQVTPAIRSGYLEHLKEIDHCISGIMNACDALHKDLMPETIDSKAYKNYYNEFQGMTIRDEKLDFIRLVKIYEAYKFCIYKFKENWGRLKEIFGDIEIGSHNHRFLQQVLSYKIYPRLDLASLVDLLNRRLNFILRISHEKIRENACNASGRYSEAIKYTFSTIFDPKISDVIQQFSEINSDKEKEKKKQKAVKSWREAKESCFTDDHTIDCRCDELFNQGYIQTMSVSSYRLKVEEAKIRRSIYIETNVGIEEKVLRRELVRSFISSVLPEKKIAKYNEFLDEYFSFQYTTFMVHFAEISHSEQSLFMYHFGPVYFLKVIINHMKESRSGFIHRFIKDDIMLRELPFEYIKLSLCHWWDTNIYERMPRLEKNSSEKYRNLVSMVMSFWRKDQNVVLSKIAQNIHAKRALKLHNLNILRPFLESELSYMFFLLYTRFLGHDFIYMPVHKQNEVKVPGRPPVQNRPQIAKV